jgi:hypothetical protein
MIRVGRAQLSYKGEFASREQAVAISRRSLELLATAAPQLSGHLGRVQISVRVRQGASAAAVAATVADALRRRL